MPVELQVIRASEFVRLDADEHLDFAASKETLRALAQACRKRGLGCAMLDLRTLPVPAKPQFTTTELALLVGTFREAGFTRQQRLAILYRHDVHGGVRSFAFLSRLGGLKVQAFSDFEAAFNWLSEEQARPVTHQPQGAAIPITTRSSGVKKLPASLTTGSPAMSTARSSRHSSRR